MAKGKQKTEDTDADPDDAPKRDDEAFLATMKSRLEACKAHDGENRRQGIEDKRFYLGEQWDSTIKAQRQDENRPCLRINKLPAFVEQLVGDQRQNRPAIKVRPVGNGADVKKARIRQGLIKSIEYRSNAEALYDVAFEHACVANWAWLGVSKEYVDDEGFDQELRIVGFNNQNSVWLDPEASPIDGEGANFGFVEKRFTREEFARRWPKAKLDLYPVDAPDSQGWWDEKHIDAVEYWERLATTETVRKNGKSRPVTRYTVKHHICTSCERLETTDWDGKDVPLVPVYGKSIDDDGKSVRRGVIHFAVDGQKLYNFYRSQAAEFAGYQTRIPWLLTKKQAEGFEGDFEAANRSGKPALFYNGDPEANGPPTRQSPPQSSQADLEQAALAAQDMRDTTGLQQASLGEKSNEKSGKAILARQKEGDTATFSFIDNLSRSIRRVGIILNDLIPPTYDASRQISITHEDGKEESIDINKPVRGKKGEYENDLTVGLFGIAVTVGPSYTTQRMEKAEILTQLLPNLPALQTAGGDILVQSLDFDGSDILSKRMRKLVPPQLLEGEDGDEGAPDPLANPVVQAKVAEVTEQAMIMQEQLQQISPQVEQLSQEKTRLQGIIDSRRLDADLRLRQFEAEEAARAEERVFELEKLRLLNEREQIRIDGDLRKLEHADTRAELEHEMALDRHDHDLALDVARAASAPSTQADPPVV